MSIYFLMLNGFFSCKKSVDNISPSEVSNLKIINGVSDVRLTWNDPIEADYSKVEISWNSPDGNFSMQIPKGVQSAGILNLISRVVYSFTVKTIDTNGNKSGGIKIIGNPDYRNTYIGNYKFKNFNHLLLLLSIFPPKDTTINDTVDYNGVIEKYEVDKLKIIYAPDYIEPDLTYESFPMRYYVYGLLYPTVSNGGILSYPGMPERYRFRGNFIGEDSINFSFSHSTHSGDESYEMFGKKINKK